MIQWNEDVPEGWAQCEAKDIANVVGGGTPQTSDQSNFSDNGHPWLTPADLSEFEGMYVAAGSRWLSDKGLKSCSAKLLPAGTVLFTSRAPIGYVAIASNPIATNQGFRSFVCKPGIEPEFLYFYLRIAKSLAEELASGTTFPEISGTNCGRIPIPLPPTAEQRRIAANLKEVLAQVNTTRERLEKVPVILKRFRQSVLATACSGWLTEGSSEAVAEPTAVPLAMLVTDLDQGWSPRCDPNPSSSDDVWGVIKTTAVQAIDFFPNENKRLPTELVPRPELEIRPGDLLITRAGPRTRAGVVCLVEETRPRLMICDKVYRFRLRESAVHPKYAVLILNSPQLLEEIDAIKTGSSDSGLNLTRQRFLDLEIPLPPLAKQQEVVRRVEALFAWADAVERRVEAARERVDRLAQAVLAKAFRGELVPTEAELARLEGRDYEPASVLLERIREQRSGSGRRTAGKRRS